MDRWPQLFTNHPRAAVQFTSYHSFALLKLPTTQTLHGIMMKYPVILQHREWIRVVSVRVGGGRRRFTFIYYRYIIFRKNPEKNQRQTDTHFIPATSRGARGCELWYTTISKQQQQRSSIIVYQNKHSQYKATKQNTQHGQGVPWPPLSMYRTR